MSLSGSGNTGCYFAGQDCRGRIQLHHVVSRQRIRRRWNGLHAEHRRGGPEPWGLMGALGDERNLVPVCVFHHGQVEQKLLYITVLPDPVREFAREYGFEADLEVDESKRSGGPYESEAA